MTEQSPHEETTLPGQGAGDPQASSPVQFSPVADISAPPATAGSADPVPVASGLQMKRRNPVGVWLGLPLITLGIYHLVWYYKVHHEMAELDPRRSVPTAGPMLVLLLLSWTVIAPLVSYYNAGGRIRNAQRAAGMTPTCSGGAGVLLMFVFGLGTWYYQCELNKVIDRYGATTPLGTQVPLFA